MTDKQIIIDGVDVSGCKNLYTDSKYNDKCCSASIGGNCLCKPAEMICIKYVEYLKKQLKAKEQECEILKMSENDGIEIIAELKAECEELKAEVKKQKEIAKEYKQRWLNSYGV